MSNEVKKTKITLLNNKVYLCGKEIMGMKRVYFAIQTVFGIGETRAKYICMWLKHQYNIEEMQFIGNLTEDIIKNLNDYIVSNFLIESDLKKQIDENIQIKVSIQCREGKRLKAGLPLSGRTKSNGRTAKKRRGK